MVGTRGAAQPAVTQPVLRSQHTQPDPIVPQPVPRDGHEAQHPQPDHETPSLETAEAEQALATRAWSFSHPPAQCDRGFRRAQQPCPPLSPRPRRTAIPPHPPALPSETPSGRLGTFGCSPKEISSFIKHQAGGGFSHAVGTAESLFSAASGKKMEGGQETGQSVPPPAASETAGAFVECFRSGGRKRVLQRS